MNKNPRFLRSRSTGNQTVLQPIVNLWILRILIRLGAHREFVRKDHFADDTLAEALGLADWIDPKDREFNPKAVRAELRALLDDAECKPASPQIPQCLNNNINWLANLVGLSSDDRKILAFTVSIHNDTQLEDTSEWLGSLSTLKLFNTLSIILDMSEQSVRLALCGNGMLNESGLVRMDQSENYYLRIKLNLLSSNFADSMCSSDADPVNLLKEIVSPCSTAKLQLSDYRHIQSTLSIVQPYLRHSLSTGLKGVNILIYGSPGTGKTQLVKALAAELKCELFEISSENDNNEPITGENRLRAYQAAQSFFSQQKTILLFDEIEDVFNDGGLFNQSTAQKRKAWINHTLEENPVPTLWLSNSIYGMDPAMIRRFDIVLEVAIPPKSHRERIIQKECGDLLDSNSLAHITESESLSPAIVSRSASVIRSIQSELGETSPSNAMELLVSNTLMAQRHKPIEKNDPNRLPAVYDPSFIHTDVDLSDVVSGLARTKAGRLCLYGPPGTGKTAYVRWLSEQMDIPLLTKRASDLISKWVGETEQNIARSFREAEHDGALLLIDEVDSFLQDRRGAQRSWEVSQVNEMLTQMESFPGVFIASTNLMDNLDQAALRRFDLKVKFGFLKSNQAWELLHNYCTNLGLPQPDPKLQSRINRLQLVTPGDFAAIARQNQFRPINSPTAMISALEAECAVKEGGKPPIGFVH